MARNSRRKAKLGVGQWLALPRPVPSHDAVARLVEAARAVRDYRPVIPSDLGRALRAALALFKEPGA